jgi:hypothetical protein
MARAVDSSPSDTLLTRLFYGTRERIAGTIYGTILVMAVLAAGADNTTIDAWELDVIMVSTVLVLWAAHVYAHAIADSVTSGERLNRGAITGVARRESSIALAGVVPGAVLVLGVLGLYSDSTAVSVALGLCMVTLGIQGVRYARAARLSALATAVFVMANLALGLLIVTLKVTLAG